MANEHKTEKEKYDFSWRIWVVAIGGLFVTGIIYGFIMWLLALLGVVE